MSFVIGVLVGICIGAIIGFILLALVSANRED